MPQYQYEDRFAGGPYVGSRLEVPTSTVLREQFAQTYEENPITSIERMVELSRAKRRGNPLTKDQALERLAQNGLQGTLQIDDNGITDEALSTLMARKRVELRRAEVFSRARGGAAEWGGRLGVALLTTMSDPINVAAAYIPITGSARYASALKAAKSGLPRLAVRAKVGAIEGAAGAAMVEPLIYAMRSQEQADYDAVDSLLNVAFGSMFGSVLHSTIGGIADVVKRPRDIKPPSEPPPEVVPAPQEKPAGFDAEALTDELLARPGEREQVDAIYAANMEQLREMSEGSFPPMRDHVERVREAAVQEKLGEAIDVIAGLDPSSRSPLPRASDTFSVPEGLEYIRGVLAKSDEEPFTKDLIIKGYQERVQDGMNPTEAAFEVLNPLGLWDRPPPLGREPPVVKEEPGQVETLPGMPIREKTLELQDKRNDESWTQWAERITRKYGRPAAETADVIKGYMREEGLSERDAALLALFEDEVLPTDADLKAFGDAAYTPSRADFQELVDEWRSGVKEGLPPPGKPRLSVIEGTKQPDPEVEQAVVDAETTLKEEPENPVEALDEDLATAESDLKATEKRLGVEKEEPDPELVETEEAAQRADQWAKASEIAVECIKNG